VKNDEAKLKGRNQNNQINFDSADDLLGGP